MKENDLIKFHQVKLKIWEYLFLKVYKKLHAVDLGYAIPKNLTVLVL